MQMHKAISTFLLLLSLFLGNDWNVQGAALAQTTHSVIDGFDYTDFPFMNLVKGSPDAFVNPPTYAYQGLLDSNGYPTSSPMESLSYAISLFPNYTGKYVVGWTGTGKYQLSPGATVYDGGTYVTGVAPRSTGGIPFNFTITGANPVVIFDFSLRITNVDGDGGLIRITAPNNLGNGDRVTIKNVSGSLGSTINGNTYTVSNRTSSTFDLVGTIFSGHYTSGGQVFLIMSSIDLIALGRGTFSKVSGLFICKLADYQNDPNGCRNPTLSDPGFNPDFITALKAIHPGVLRPLDASRIIASTATSYANWTPITALSYTQNRWIPAYWAGSCGGADTYTAKLSSFSLTDGAIIQCQVANANLTTTPTLNVNGTGAIPIINSSLNQEHATLGGTITLGDVMNFTFAGSCISRSPHTFSYQVSSADLSGGFNKLGADITTASQSDSTLRNAHIYFTNAGNGALGYLYNNNLCPITFSKSVAGSSPTETITLGTLPVSTFTANSFWTFTYNAVVGAWIAQQGGLITGWPYDIQIALANAVGAGLWIQIPIFYTNASVTALGQHLVTNANLSNGVWWEYSNETWNFGQPQFSQTNTLGASLGFPDDDERMAYGWYALKVRQFMGLITQTWGGKSGLHRVLAFQMAEGTNFATNNIYRFQGADLCGTNGSCATPNPTYQELVDNSETCLINLCGADYNVVPNRPIDFSDGGSYATYYSGAVLSPYSINGSTTNTVPCAAGGANTSDIACMTRAADDYQSGDTSDAFAWMDNDIRQGQADGRIGGETLFSLYKTFYPGWNNIFSHYGKPIWLYEGGYEGGSFNIGKFPPTAFCGNVAILASYCGADGKIFNMVTGYKNSSLFKQLVTDQIDNFLSESPINSLSAWYSFGGGGGQWGLYPLNIYSIPFQSYAAIGAYNSPLKQ
jgi:hypothetical protein